MRAHDTMTGVAALACLVMQACAGTSARPGSEPSPGGPESAELSELEALYRARADSARMGFTEADVAFMQGMIGHHAQALVMAGLVPSRSDSDAVRTLAARTINAQNDEIASMRAWLEARNQTVPEIRIAGTDLVIGDGAHDLSMPGMLSSEQMQELESARGPDFDRLFLSYMIQHHSGAVTMVHELFATDGAALDDAVFKIASDIQVDQTTEVNRMESMLEKLSDSGIRP